MTKYFEQHLYFYFNDFLKFYTKYSFVMRELYFQYDMRTEILKGVYTQKPCEFKKLIF